MLDALQVQHLARRRRNQSMAKIQSYCEWHVESRRLIQRRAMMVMNGRHSDVRLDRELYQWVIAACPALIFRSLRLRLCYAKTNP